MPKLSDYRSKPWPNILATGDSGSGKSVFFAHGPSPSAWFLVDKDTPTIVPGMDLDHVYFKTYPPAEVDMRSSDYLPPRNVADAIIDDVTIIKNHFVSIQRGKRTPLLMPMMDGTKEEWETPAMVVLEGAAPTSHQAMNRILAINKKHAVDDFTNKFRAYDMRLQDLMNLYAMLLRLPCVVGVSTWPEEESKTEKVDGKAEIIRTGVLQPRFGGQLNDLIPGQFDSSFFFFTLNGNYYIRTQDDAKHRGFKIGSHIGIGPTVGMTIGKNKEGKELNPVRDLWKLLLNSQTR